ncbi:DUF1302 domain-containing protein [Aquabacterium sp.]|uniref:DUF1302 domain-containing protein n=1 Tax=Aquabacterium sp. TaxID=1872578 RepID=UPI002C096A9B|nr:DUF1302 family protein [Aquabacterium sp.]HSW06746.1 DUF1302 family protein [Aquabacterium sp.]
MSYLPLRNTRCTPLRHALALAAVAALAQPAGAAELINTDDLSLRWDNSIKYTLGARTTKPSSFYTANLNTNDGDAAFPDKRDIVTNRLDLLSEFDLTFKDKASSGLRISAAAWYDHVYRRSHAAIDPLSYNASSVSNTEFTAYARKWAGANAEFYDAFVHSGVDIGGHNLSFRLGRHTLMWGESLMLPGNGIAAGQAPTDVNKVLTVPGIQTKDFLMPVNQLSASFALTPKWDLAGYYQLEFRPTRLPPSGTFFSPADLIFDGAERLMLAPGFGVPLQGTQQPPERKGQYGIAAKYRDQQSGSDYGFYYLRYTDKTPQVILQLNPIPVPPFMMPTNYFFVYPQKIDVYGVSTSSHVGDASVAGEVSIRNNTPLTSLASALVAFPGVPLDAVDNPVYAVGRSLHFQASTIWQLPRLPGFDAASLVGEIGGNTLLKTTRNAAARNTETSKTELKMGLSFEPTWYQALADIDLSLPLTLMYNFNAKTPAVASTGGSARGGSLALALKFTYANSIKGALQYTRQLGRDQDNAFGDRDFIALNLNYSF